MVRTTPLEQKFWGEQKEKEPVVCGWNTAWIQLVVSKRSEKPPAAPQPAEQGVGDIKLVCERLFRTLDFKISLEQQQRQRQRQRQPFAHPPSPTPCLLLILQRVDMDTRAFRRRLPRLHAQPNMRPTTPTSDSDNEPERQRVDCRSGCRPYGLRMKVSRACCER